MHKRTIYYSIGFAAVLVVALGTLNFNTDTQLLRGTIGYVSEEDVATGELSDDVIVCDSNANIISKFYNNGEAQNINGIDLEFLGIESDNDNILNSINLEINSNSLTLDLDDSFSGSVNKPLVVGDNLSFSTGYISFNVTAGDGQISFHVRYVDENELILEINPVASCVPINSTVVMIPCDDCKIRTSLSQQDYWVMLKDSKLKISDENFVGSTLDSSEFEGVDLSDLELSSAFMEVDLETEFETQIAVSGSDSLNRTFLYLKN